MPVLVCTGPPAQRENGQLREAVVSHAVVDQAIGVVVAVGGLCPDQGFEVLREVSQRTEVKLRQASAMIVDWAHSEQQPEEIRRALEGALAAARCV
ncbi:ANTAR domain-containing protein [Streptomyces liliiviolaceus]|uniref:ANTAR domain-containing protein n=1 Tax=Streptomyces liliiviolaceus TaxID=2823109 RepID=UPI0024948320|nr:ANTAR domain-containing protein [Streptomyces liliiviolaceus]